MVNAGVVNAGSAGALYAHFSEFLLFFARFSRLKNPVKYNRNLCINRKTVHFLPAGRHGKPEIVLDYQCNNRRIKF